MAPSARKTPIKAARRKAQSPPETEEPSPSKQSRVSGDDDAPQENVSRANSSGAGHSQQDAQERNLLDQVLEDTLQFHKEMYEKYHSSAIGGEIVDPNGRYYNLNNGEVYTAQELEGTFPEFRDFIDHSQYYRPDRGNRQAVLVPADGNTRYLNTTTGETVTGAELAENDPSFQDRVRRDYVAVDDDCKAEPGADASPKSGSEIVQDWMTDIRQQSGGASPQWGGNTSWLSGSNDGQDEQADQSFANISQQSGDVSQDYDPNDSRRFIDSSDGSIYTGAQLKQQDPDFPNDVEPNYVFLEETCDRPRGVCPNPALARVRMGQDGAVDTTGESEYFST